MTALTGLLAACSASVARCGTSSPASPTLPARNEELTRAFSDIPFHGKKAADSLSDVALLSNGLAVLVSDEGTEIGIARPGKRGRALDLLAAFPSFAASIGGKAPKEIDLEAASAEGNRVLVSGSASLKRKKPQAGEDNAVRIREVELASGEGNPHSNYLFEFTLSDDGEPTLVGTHDLRRLLLAQPGLELFADLPSKDNGLDVEGVTLRGDTAFVGLRGPVLRGHAVVARVGLRDEHVSLDFLALGGLGIRSMCAADGGGFWLLAGPTLDVTDPFVVYAWDGAGSVFSADPVGGGGLRRVAELTHAAGEKPEGIFEFGGALCILYEGAPGGGPRCLPRPGR